MIMSMNRNKEMPRLGQESHAKVGEPTPKDVPNATGFQYEMQVVLQRLRY